MCTSILSYYIICVYIILGIKSINMLTSTIINCVYLLYVIPFRVSVVRKTIKKPGYFPVANRSLSKYHRVR